MKITGIFNEIEIILPPSMVLLSQAGVDESMNRPM